MTPERLTEIEARFGADVRARREHDPAVRDVLALTAEVRRLRANHDRRCLSLTESENNVYCDCRTLAMIDGAAAATERMTAERGRLRAAVDAALALAEKFDADEVTVISGRGFEPSYSGRVVAHRIRAALAPVADPDPHTTSDKETT
jgi:hypothetical protein